MTLPLNQIINGDTLTELRKLPNESIDCVITSPPYWGLRDYGIDLQPDYCKMAEKRLAEML